MTPRGRPFGSLKKAVAYMEKFGDVGVLGEMQMPTDVEPRRTSTKRWKGWKGHTKLPTEWKMKIKQYPAFKIIIKAEDDTEMDISAAIKKYCENTTALLELESEMKEEFKADDKFDSIIPNIKIKEEYNEDEYDFVDDNSFDIEDSGFMEMKSEGSQLNIFDNIDDLDTFDTLVLNNV